MIDMEQKVESEGFFRLEQILKLIPISKTRWYEGVATGEFPKQIKPFGVRVSLWRKSDIYDLMKSLEAC